MRRLIVAAAMLSLWMPAYAQQEPSQRLYLSQFFDCVAKRKHLWWRRPTLRRRESPLDSKRARTSRLQTARYGASPMNKLTVRVANLVARRPDGGAFTSGALEKLNPGQAKLVRPR